MGMQLLLIMSVKINVNFANETWHHNFTSLCKLGLRNLILAIFNFKNILYRLTI